MSANLSKNDQAWQSLFEQENILEQIQKNGFVYISSQRINEIREARLMTKFDHQFQLPKPFQDNALSIQPISRSYYIIGPFESYCSLPKNTSLARVQYVNLPPYIETIVPKSITTESSAVICAYLSGMLTDILGEETFFTVFGRMSTGAFSYQINNIKTCQFNRIEVNNSQCEIDGGFEGETKFAIIEAKCQSVDDFIIRQLYYPYKLWKSKINKEIVPIFLSFSNNIFTFYVFEFFDSNQYNSIRLKSTHKYCIGQYEIDLSDIRKIINEVKKLKNDNNLTFPQANKFARVIDLLDKLYINEGSLNKEEITTEYAFDVRQTDYYVSAGVYLGLIEKSQNEIGNCYSLSAKGQKIMALDPRRKNLELVKTILSYKVFYLVLNEYLKNSGKPTRQTIINIMRDHLNKLNETTLYRRAQTVEKWVEWILELTST